jgi:hypothetical protein
MKDLKEDTKRNEGNNGLLVKVFEPMMLLGYHILRGRVSFFTFSISCFARKHSLLCF